MKIFVALLLSVLITTTGCASIDKGASVDKIVVTKTGSTELQNTPKISVQLWSVRDDLKKDFKGTLTALAEMGFDGVEFAGDYGPFENDPKGLNQFLESLGLESSGSHVWFDVLTDEKIEQTLMFSKEMGSPLVIVPYDSRAFKLETVGENIADLNRVAEKAETFGLKVGYHNHGEEFATIDGVVPWDMIAQKTPESVVLQIDVGWVMKAGKDPVKFINKYPGRTTTTHFKPVLIEADEGTDKTVFIGTDSTDWTAIIEATYTVGGTDWLVVEQEEYPNGLTPLQCVKISKLALDGLVLQYEKSRGGTN